MPSAVRGQPHHDERPWPCVAEFAAVGSWPGCRLAASPTPSPAALPFLGRMHHADCAHVAGGAEPHDGKARNWRLGGGIGRAAPAHRPAHRPDLEAAGNDDGDFPHVGVGDNLDVPGIELGLAQINRHRAHTCVDLGEAAQVAVAGGRGTGWPTLVTLAAVRRRTAFRISAATMIDSASAVQMSHCLTSSVVVFRLVWNGRRTVDMTSRKKDNPVVMMNVRSEKVSRENADCRSSFASIEKNRLSSENVTTPMVRAMVSVCSCSAQLITLSVPVTITSPTETSQMMSPWLRIGCLGGRGGRSISPAAGLLYPSPMDWIVTVVKATHKICSGRSGSPSAMLKMLAPRKEMMKPNMHPISNRMYRLRL